MPGGLQETQSIKTSFEFKDNVFGNQTETFQHTVLNPMNLQQEIETARLSEQVFQDARAQMQGLAPPVTVHAVRQPIVQARAPEQAPRELSYKERKSQEKNRQRNLKRGQRLTRQADELTATLVDKQQAMDENIRRFVDHGYTRDDISEELTDTLKSIQDVKITSDMFTPENYASNYENLKTLLEKGSYVSRIAGSEEHMRQLRAQDPILYTTAQRWQRLTPVLSNMIRLANISHGLKMDGSVLQDHELSSTETAEDGTEVVIPNIVAHTRNQFGNILENFRNTVEQQEQEHLNTITGELHEEFEKELRDQKTWALVTRIEEHEEQEWIQSPSLTYGSEENYQTIQNLKELIVQSGEIYRSNKEVVDKMYSDIIRRFEVLGELTAQRNTWEEMKYRYQAYENRPRGGDGDRLCRHAEAQVNKLMLDSKDVEDNLTSIKTAMTRLLEGKMTNMLEAAVLETYGYHAAADMEVAAAPLKELASCRAVRSAWQNAALQKLMDEKKFVTDHPESQYVTRTVTLFRQGDDEYNLDLLKTLKEYTEEKKKFEASEEENAHYRSYYNKIRSIAEPEVERIMAWDMERFLQMDDSQLLGAQKELDDLFGANMFTSDLMKLPYPQAKKGVTFTMKDDVLGDRMELFSHKLNILRALVDKSRGLAFKAVANLGYPIEDYLTQVEIQKGAYRKLAQDPSIGDNPLAMRKAFAAQQIDLGNRQLNSSQSRWNDWRDVNSPAFKDACLKKFQEKGVHDRLLDRVTPHSEIAKKYSRHFSKFLPDATQEEMDVVKRVKRENYRLIGWDKAEARAYARSRGLDPSKMEDKALNLNLGEGIFRTFNIYRQTPGGMTQSPEEFQQMLLDLSAGAQLQRDVNSEREIFEAREKNLRGCLQFKESLRVSYEYLGRKYGYGLESLTALEIYDHWEEILRDFSNIQVDDNFINRIPGMVDLENEEDKVLYNQINYLSALNFVVQNTMVLIGTGVPVAEMMKNIRRRATGPAMPFRTALKEMGAAAGMTETVRWEEKAGQRRQPTPEDPEAKEARWQEFQRMQELRREELVLQRETSTPA